jgi:replication factor A1
LAVEGFFENKKQPVEAKVGDLTPQSKAVNVTAKVVSKTEVREIPMGRDGSAHKVSDALIGDETGVVYLTLWDDNIEKVNEGDTVRIENGYVTLFKGNIRLNIGKYGKLEPAKEPLTVEVNTENNVSSKTYEQERRPFRAADEDSAVAADTVEETDVVVAAADTAAVEIETDAVAVAAADTDQDTKLPMC